MTEIIHNFKILQIHFNNEETNYSVIYVNQCTEWFRYEVNAFITASKYFEIMIDGKMQPPNFADSPVFRMVDGRCERETRTRIVTTRKNWWLFNSYSILWL